MSFHRSLSLPELVEDAADSIMSDEIPNTLSPGSTTRKRRLIFEEKQDSGFVSHQLQQQFAETMINQFASFGEKLRQTLLQEKEQTQADFSLVIKEMVSSQQDQNTIVSTSMCQLNESIAQQQEQNLTVSNSMFQLTDAVNQVSSRLTLSNKETNRQFTALEQSFSHMQQRVSELSFHAERQEEAVGKLESKSMMDTCPSVPILPPPVKIEPIASEKISTPTSVPNQAKDQKSDSYSWFHPPNSLNPNAVPKKLSLLRPTNESCARCCEDLVPNSVTATPSVSPVGTTLDSSVGLLHRISVPPKFAGRNLEGWVRDLLFWRRVYASIPDHHILAVIGLQGEDELKEIIREIFDDNPVELAGRTLNDFVSRVRKEFGKVAEMNRLDVMGGNS